MLRRLKKLLKGNKDTVSHHWVGLSPNPHDYFGFIYVITDLDSGKHYIGKKQYWMSKRVKVGCKSKVTDKQSPKWKPCCWRESDWRTYSGSSKNLDKWVVENPSHQYEFRIIRQCRSRGTLHYAEVEALVVSGSIWRKDIETEEPLFFNRQIPAVRFVPPGFYPEEYWDIDLTTIGET